MTQRKDAVYIGHSRVNSHRWASLLEAALNQPNPSRELVRALSDLETKKGRFHNSPTHRTKKCLVGTQPLRSTALKKKDFV
jgi:hypothetical protein